MDMNELHADLEAIDMGGDVCPGATVVASAVVAPFDATVAVSVSGVVSGVATVVASEVDLGVDATVVASGVESVDDVPTDVATVEVVPKVVTAVDLATQGDFVVDQPPMGSSRSYGGFIRGRALGNVANHADLRAGSLELVRPDKGEVFLYITDKYPRDVKFEELKGDSELLVMVKVGGRMGPILAMVARKCSIIHNPEYHIYYRRSTKWIALGRFDQAMQDNDECEWEISDGNTPELHLLIVSLNSMNLIL